MQGKLKLWWTSCICLQVARRTSCILWHISNTVLNSGLTLPLAIVAICYLKCRVATNITHWLNDKYSLGQVQKLLKETAFFPNIAFIIPSHFINVPYFTLWMLDFFNTILVSNSLDPDQAQHFVGPDLGPNCLQRLSADNKSRP